MQREEAERVLLAQVVHDQSLNALIGEGIGPEHFSPFKDVASEIWKNADKFIPSRASAEKKSALQSGKREWSHAPQDWNPSPEDFCEAIVLLQEYHAQEKLNRELLSLKGTLSEPGGWEKVLVDLPRKLDEIYDDFKGRNKEEAGSRIPRIGLDSNPTPPEELVEGILIKGDVHHLFADADNGKSWIALWLTKKVLIHGYKVLYFDYENGFRIIRERLKDHLKVRDHLLEENFFYSSAPSLDFTRESVQEYLATLEDFGPDLLVWDSWAPALGSCGVDESSNFDLAKWSAAFLTPARNKGITNVILDHVPHGGDRARGASRKRDFVDIQWFVKKAEDFDRQTLGAVELRRRKDRESWLPEKVGFDIGGTSFKCERWGFADFEALLTSNGRKLKKFLEENPSGATWSQITKEVFNGKDSATKRAIENLRQFDLIQHQDKLYSLRSSGEATSTVDSRAEVPSSVGEARTPNKDQRGGSSGNGSREGKTPRSFRTSTTQDEWWKPEGTDQTSALGIPTDTQAEGSVVDGRNEEQDSGSEGDGPREDGPLPEHSSQQAKLLEYVRECERLFEREPEWVPDATKDDKALYTHALGMSWASSLFDNGYSDENMILEALKIVLNEQSGTHATTSTVKG